LYELEKIEEERKMKKVIKQALKGLALVLLAAAALAGCAKKEAASAAKGMKVGMTVQDLSNQVWSASCEALKKLVEADGGQFTYMDCKSNSSTQIGQIENFIANKVDILVIHAADKNSVEASLKTARSGGIKVFCWDDDLVNSDINWLLNNFDLGYMIGDQAALWINEKFGGSCEVAILDYPQIQILLERGNGIVAALKEKAPNARIVAQSSAINPIEGQAKTETFLQANPNIKVIAAIGGGGAVGANNAVKASGKLTPDFGIFAADATIEELQAIVNDEANRMSVLLTGGPNEIAKEIYSWLKKLYAGEPVEKQVYRKMFPITKANAAQYM
jgi:ribose transport system substrate-binding protein